MVINDLEIVNFRRFLSKKIVFKNGINIIVGLNATGKTTILESIYYLGVTKSFKTSEESILINAKCEEFAIFATIERDNLKSNLKIKKMKNAKVVVLNETPYKKVSDYLGTVLVVCFSNNDCTKLNGSAKDRRSLFEPLICQMSNFYVNECNNYKRILNNRNALLKRLSFEKKESSLKLLEVINKQLVECGSKIINVRTKVVDKINLEINEIYNKISGCSERIQLEYCSNTTPGEFLKQLEMNFKEEIKKGYTEVGPHRDDYEFKINGLNVTTTGSQGQQKSVMIALKMSFSKIIEKVKKEIPILLLDDVLGELDELRQNNLLNYIKNYQQAIISTSTLSDIKLENLKNANIIELK